ncbi:hypothetical protein HOK021_57320 [Streptomyces hygroscopicus]|nr:hypothetical protein HOK021_57320 [Streptomyces hygroscopicus]
MSGCWSSRAWRCNLRPTRSGPVDSDGHPLGRITNRTPAGAPPGAGPDAARSGTLFPERAASPLFLLRHHLSRHAGS